MRCAKCGNTLAATARFCGKCGTVVFSQEAVTETAVLAPARMAAVLTPPAGLPPRIVAIAPPAGPPPGPPPGMPPAAGGSQALVVGLCALVALLLVGGGFWIWSQWNRPGKPGPTAARLYMLPSINREALGTGFMLALGAEFSFPAAIVTDTLQERVPFSAGWKIRINRNSGPGSHFECGVLWRGNSERLWYHRDGRLVEKPEAIPLTCDGDLLPAAAANGMACGYVDAATLRFRIQPVYQNCLPFSEGLAAVRQDGKFGYVNTGGTMVIRPAFAGVDSFSEGLAKVQTKGDGVTGYIDRSGKLVIPEKFVHAEAFQQSFAIVSDANTLKRGFIDKSGKYRFSEELKDILTPFAEGRAFVIRQGKLVLIDTGGQQVAEWEKGTGAGEFVNGVAKVQVGGLIHLVDRAGRQLTKAGFPEMGPLFLGHATAVDSTGRLVLIDQTGKVLLSAEGGQLGRYEGKYITRTKGDALELLDRQGKVHLRVENGQIIRGTKP